MSADRKFYQVKHDSELWKKAEEAKIVQTEFIKRLRAFAEYAGASDQITVNSDKTAPICFRFDSEPDRKQWKKMGGGWAPKVRTEAEQMLEEVGRGSNYESVILAEVEGTENVMVFGFDGRHFISRCKAFCIPSFEGEPARYWLIVPQLDSDSSNFNIGKDLDQFIPSHPDLEDKAQSSWEIERDIEKHNARVKEAKA